MQWKSEKATNPCENDDEDDDDSLLIKFDDDDDIVTEVVNLDVQENVLNGEEMERVEITEIPGIDISNESLENSRPLLQVTAKKRGR
ncbi:hypothetical protein BpHYR1_028900 [Brachionus plicatilis]|uniref:Uncharacterized protein n=1 Tax=Brachionus plicatilis TaxID=10195 RepID=A0A3M7RZU6_BRAPC|nr:hypothetical protein BpHYR1_028900 [Brachionus plicatilis]